MSNKTHGHTVLLSLHWPVSLTIVLSLSRIIVILAKSGRSDPRQSGVARPLRAAPPVVLAVVMVRIGGCPRSDSPPEQRGPAYRFRAVTGVGGCGSQLAAVKS
jgi:hypothetical protein